MFAVDMEGAIYIIEHEQLMAEPFLDVARTRGKAFVHDDTEKGLTSLAFHPDYFSPSAPGFGRVYTASTESTDSGIADFETPVPGGRVSHHDVITEWRVDAENRNRIDPSSRREVFRIAHPFRDHTIGQIAFNPNARRGDSDYGMLYIGVGDGGDTMPVRGEVDAFRNAQNPQTPLGKILRINPLPGGGRSYTVPTDNPFLRQAKFIKEIWAYGLRNPQRFCWDTGGDRKMILVDIGQAQAEEVNVGLAGSNYGWGEREGMFAVNRQNPNEVLSLPPNDATLGYTYPAVQYRHDIGRAITGGYVYRGRLIPPLRGMYVFGDIASGRILFTDAARLVNGRLSKFGEIKLKHAARQKTLLEVLDSDERADLRFGTDAAGEIYVLTKRDGMVRKLSMAEQ
jgi:glucose/arabinose dehydrogenase